jgi:uncharacterized low-complexity protein
MKKVPFLAATLLGASLIAGVALSANAEDMGKMEAKESTHQTEAVEKSCGKGSCGHKPEHKCGHKPGHKSEHQCGHKPAGAEHKCGHKN